MNVFDADVKAHLRACLPGRFVREAVKTNYPLENQRNGEICVFGAEKAASA